VSFDRWARPASVILSHTLRLSEFRDGSFDRWARPASVILSHQFRLSEFRDGSFDRWARPASVMFLHKSRLIEVMRIPLALSRMVLRSLSDKLGSPEKFR